MIVGHPAFAPVCPSKCDEDDSSRRNSDDDTKEFKSKNLEAERKRRKKLSDRLLELRSLCPNITNMNKATIITDTITYLQNLQNTVEDLSDELHSIDAFLKEELIHCKNKVIQNAEKEMKECGLQTEVQVTHLYGNKVWIQIICPKKNGALTKLIEAVTVLGFQPQDTSVTTIKGGLLVTLCVETYHGALFIEAAKIKDFLMDTVRNM